MGNQPSNRRNVRSRRFTDIRLSQNCILIWLDSNINETNTNYRNDITLLQDIFNNVKPFTDAQRCINFLRDIMDEKVFMIISGTLGEQIVPLIHEFYQLDSIFIYCMNKEFHQRWAAEWIKIKGVFTEISSVYEALEQAVRQNEQNTISISIIFRRNNTLELNSDQINQSFMYTLVLKEVLLSLPFDKDDFKEFIDCCRESYANNEVELKIIDELEHKYRKDKSILWYTREGFLYHILNHALRSMEIDVLIIMGFFIQDLHNQIKQLHSKQFGNRHSMKPFIVYRGQHLSKTVFDQMEKANGGLLSFNSFLSTSKDRTIGEKFTSRALDNPDSIGILFIMTIDPSVSSTPFASISHISYYRKEDEILFSMHTTFRIRSMKSTNEDNRLWHIEQDGMISVDFLLN